MPLSNVFKTSTARTSVTDGSQGTTDKPGVSDFLTVQSFTNFAAMCGAITAAWHAAPAILPQASGVWFPYALAFLWAIISYQISKDGLAETSVDGKKVVPWPTTLQALLIAFINALVLGGSVVGTGAAVKAATGG